MGPRTTSATSTSVTAAEKHDEAPGPSTSSNIPGETPSRKVGGAFLKRERKRVS